MLPTAVSQVVESAGKLVVGLGLTWYLLTVRGVSPEIGAAGAMAGVTVGSLLALLVLVYLQRLLLSIITRQKRKRHFARQNVLL